MNWKSFLTITGLILFVLLLNLAGLMGKKEEWRTYAREPANLILPDGRVERCLTCHQGIEAISSAHPVETFGCVSCHGGDGLALEKNRSHQGLRGGNNPAALTVAEESCGQQGCHLNSGNLYRSPVETMPLSPMATKAGEITETAFTYGWQKDHLSRFGVTDVNDISGSTGNLEEKGLVSSRLQQFTVGSNPLQKKLVQNCLSQCHLNTGSGKNNLEANHLEGCAACHTPYVKGSTYQGDDPTINPSEPGHASYHQLTSAIKFNQCNSCHNQGVHSVSQMDFIYREDIPRTVITDPHADRNQAYYIPQAQYALCEVKLDCIDCHTRNEVMGDGHLYGNKTSAQVIQCRNCHGTLASEPEFLAIDSQNHDAVWASRYLGEGFPEVQPGMQVALTDQNEPMLNVRREQDDIVLYSKIDGKKYFIPQVIDGKCQQSLEEQKGEDCHACHDISSK